MQDDGSMTIVQATPQRLRPRRPPTPEEQTELRALTAHLPQLVTGWTTPLYVDAALRLDAAMWELACRHDVEVGPDAHVLDVVDGLASKGWSTGHARDALRAFVMLRWGGGDPAGDDPAGDDLEPRTAARLLSYLELRTRFG